MITVLRTQAALRGLPGGWAPGAWTVSHGADYNVLRDPGLNHRRARLAAAEGGPITERALRDLRASRREHVHIGSDVVGAAVFMDTMYVGNLEGVVESTAT